MVSPVMSNRIAVLKREEGIGCPPWTPHTLAKPRAYTTACPYFRMDVQT